MAGNVKYVAEQVQEIPKRKMIRLFYNYDRDIYLFTKRGLMKMLFQMFYLSFCLLSRSPPICIL